jgi:hypothetical protein
MIAFRYFFGCLDRAWIVADQALTEIHIHTSARPFHNGKHTLATRVGPIVQRNLPTSSESPPVGGLRIWKKHEVRETFLQIPELTFLIINELSFAV